MLLPEHALMEIYLILAGNLRNRVSCDILWTVHCLVKLSSFSGKAQTELFPAVLCNAPLKNVEHHIPRIHDFSFAGWHYLRLPILNDDHAVSRKRRHSD